MSYMLRNAFVICLFFLVISCSSTKSITITAVAPSPVDFSKDIKKIGILNSSKAALSKESSKGLENLIAEQERWIAIKGSEASLTGLFDELAQDQRFDTVLILEKLKNVMTDFGTNPSDEAWNKMSKICKEHNVDALFSLASYNADIKYSLKRTKVEQIDMMRDISEVPGKKITLKTLIENGWRIYYPKEKVLIDDFTSSQQIVESAKGENPIKALEALNIRKQELLTKSISYGTAYGQRMSPQEITIERKYYASDTPNFKMADQRIQNGNYNEAIAFWKKETLNSKVKIRARAYHNLAVLSEFNGDLNTALNQASKSYEVLKTSASLDYIKIIEERQAQTNQYNALVSNKYVD